MQHRSKNKKKWVVPSVKELIINSQTTNGKGNGQETIKKGKLSQGSYQ